jgi:hypothetical protein
VPFVGLHRALSISAVRVRGSFLAIMVSGDSERAGWGWGWQDPPQELELWLYNWRTGAHVTVRGTSCL